jgi:hypothetical protein
VWQQKCSKCGEVEPYRGDADAILNSSNHTLITYELGFDYWHGVVSKQATFTAYHQDMRARLALQGCQHLLPSVNTLRSATAGHPCAP